MTVTGGVRSAQFIEVERDHANAVSGIQQHLNASLFKLGDHPLIRHQQAGWAGDGVDHGQPGSFGDAVHDGVQGLVCVFDRERNVDRDHRCAPAFSNEIDRVSARLVGVVRHEDFIPSLKHERTQHRVHTRGRIFHESEVVGLTGQLLRQCCSSPLEDSRHQVLKESNRFVFHQVLPGALLFSDSGWCCSKRTVVQENAAFLEPPQARTFASARLVHETE